MEGNYEEMDLKGKSGQFKSGAVKSVISTNTKFFKIIQIVDFFVGGRPDFQVFSAYVFRQHAASIYGFVRQKKIIHF